MFVPVLLLAHALAAPPPMPDEVARGLAVTSDVPEMLPPGHRGASSAPTALTCTQADDRGDREITYGGALRVRWVTPGAPEEGQPAVRTAPSPLQATLDVARRLARALERRGWTPDPIVATDTQELRWRFRRRDQGEVIVRRVWVRDDAWEVELRAQLDPARACPAYPPLDTWDELVELERALAQQGTTWRWADDERHASAVTLRRYRTTGRLTLQRVVELTRYGAALVPGGTTLEDVLAAGVNADRTRLLEDDVRVAWGTSSGAATFRMSGCTAALHEGALERSPFSRALYPAVLEDDPVFPLTEHGPEAGKVLRIALEVDPSGAVVDAEVAGELTSDKGRHQALWDTFRRCAVDVARGLRLPSGEHPREGALLLAIDRTGIRLAE